MRVLVIGSGNLGSVLFERLQNRIGISDSSITDVDSVGHSELDITDSCSVEKYFSSKYRTIDSPDVVINCVAFTDTKSAEHEKMEESYKVNVLGVRNLRNMCILNDSKLIHISTDYVYSENSETDGDEISENGIHLFSKLNDEFPINVYGMHKLLGEKELHSDFDTVIRVGWLYGKNSRGHSFVDKIVASAKSAKSSGKGEIKVVDDVFGIPTSTRFVSDSIIGFIENSIEPIGVRRLAPLGSPVSRYELAKIIVKELGLDVNVVPCKSSDFNSPIKYPKNTSMKNDFPLYCTSDINWYDDLISLLREKKQTIC